MDKIRLMSSTRVGRFLTFALERLQQGKHIPDFEYFVMCFGQDAHLREGGNRPSDSLVTAFSPYSTIAA